MTMPESGRPQGWQQFVMPIIAALITAIIGGGMAAYITVQLTQEKVSDLTRSMTTMNTKIEALTVSVNATEKTAALVKNTLDEGIRQTLASQGDRLSKVEERAGRLTDTVADQRILLNSLQSQVDGMRRASEPLPTGRR
jgi:hypothetical protein